MNRIEIKGARLHNLKNIDISIPKNKLVLITGVSGSGKSSLVFDIIFDEGRKQYLKSLGILSGFSDEDKFDSITGIGPTIAVQQRIIRQGNPRSTVGTRTNILNLLSVLYAKEGERYCYNCEEKLNSNLTCPDCGEKEERLEANFFSYNHPNGMCIECSGRGAEYKINLENLIPDTNTTLKEVLDKVEITAGYRRILNKNFSTYLNTPFNTIPDEVKEDILHGHYTKSNFQNQSFCLTKAFQRLQKKGADLSGFYELIECPKCSGYRVGEEAREVLLGGKHIGELSRMTLADLSNFLNHLNNSGIFSQLGLNILKEIMSKISGLINMRLGHLYLYRSMPTLSGGEIQRLFLNSHLESKMDSLIYILDEPTVGLHEYEKRELLKSIKELNNLGNTVIVVEHDKTAIEMADHIIDIGPKAGVKGGDVMYQGDLSGLIKCKDSITGQYFSGEKVIPKRVKLYDKSDINITLTHAETNNLKSISVSFPLNRVVGIAGVSGSGKSSLVSGTLIPKLKGCFKEVRDKDSDISGLLEGIENISGYAEVTQAPIGRNMSSNPASYIGIWDKIRKLFSQEPLAKKQNLTAGHFSFNSKGACKECGGSGLEKIWLGGSLFIHNKCPECNGYRYSKEALSVKYKEKSIVDILNMQVTEAITFFEGQKGITSTLDVMDRIGMGYIELGQPSPTLSGGEAQRIKLAKEIGKQRKGNILYILDEPTTGLSFYDKGKLLQLLDELVINGNSVIVIEHDLEVLNSCDWIIELGPGGGTDGGYIIAQGTPASLKDNPESVTGRYLND